MSRDKEMKKLVWLLAIMVTMLFAFSACGNGEPSAPATSADNGQAAQEPEELLELTLEELKQFDGQDGNPAYVVVDGVVYDVTDSDRWRGGVHNSHEAGQDLTQEINNVSPHGTRVLERMPIVGKIVEQ